MQVCASCRREFEPYPVVNGERLNLRGRKRCLACLPLRRLRAPRKRVVRAQKSKVCARCGELFPTRLEIDGVVRNLHTRTFCLNCSPFGIHNTSKDPPRESSPDALAEMRRKRRNAKTYRYQKKRRREVKLRLIEARGGVCQSCGYSRVPTALEFHHRDRRHKLFALSHFNGSYSELDAEAAKCDLLCANCHRTIHARQDDLLADVDVIVRVRRELKARAAQLMGGSCAECGRGGPLAVFEFHHLDATTKDFGLSEDGNTRAWARIVAELGKCVMLCANCHREVHAGVRQLDLRIGEHPAPYAA